MRSSVKTQAYNSSICHNIRRDESVACDVWWSGGCVIGGQCWPLCRAGWLRTEARRSADPFQTSEERFVNNRPGLEHLQTMESQRWDIFYFDKAQDVIIIIWFCPPPPVWHSTSLVYRDLKSRSKFASFSILQQVTINLFAIIWKKLKKTLRKEISKK